MMDARRRTYIYLLSAASLSLLSGPIESAGDFMALIGMTLSAASVVCVILLGVYATPYFQHSYVKGQGAIAFWTAAFPFLIVGLLSMMDGIQLNPHGLAIPGYFFYALISEVIAAGMAICFIKHRRQRKHSPPVT